MILSYIEHFKLNNPKEMDLQQKVIKIDLYGAQIGTKGDLVIAKPGQKTIIVKADLFKKIKDNDDKIFFVTLSESGKVNFVKKMVISQKKLERNMEVIAEVMILGPTATMITAIAFEYFGRKYYITDYLKSVRIDDALSRKTSGQKKAVVHGRLETKEGSLFLSSKPEVKEKNIAA